MIVKTTIRNKKFQYEMPENFNNYGWLPRIKAKNPRIYESLCKNNPVLYAIERQLQDVEEMV